MNNPGDFLLSHAVTRPSTIGSSQGSPAMNRWAISSRPLRGFEARDISRILYRNVVANELSEAP